MKSREQELYLYHVVLVGGEQDSNQVTTVPQVSGNNFNLLLYMIWAASQ